MEANEIKKRIAALTGFNADDIELCESDGKHGELVNVAFTANGIGWRVEMQGEQGLHRAKEFDTVVRVTREEWRKERSIIEGAWGLGSVRQQGTGVFVVCEERGGCVELKVNWCSLGGVDDVKAAEFAAAIKEAARYVAAHPLRGATVID